jgi:TatA/E family protein of Tat protein translocase
MPSVGPTEIILVLVIALLVLGPTKLPELGRQLGRGIRQFREAARNVTKEMGAEDLVEDLKGLNEARGTFGQTVRKELGLDELGPFPNLDEVGKEKPAAAQTAAVTADVLVANATVEATAVAAPVPTPAAPVAAAAAEAPVFASEAPAADATAETTPDVTAAPVKATAPRKRTPRAAAEATPAAEPKAAPRKRAPKAAAVATPADQPKAAPAPRKRAPKAPVATAPADEPPTASAAAAARPARKRTVKADPSETA